MSGTPNEPNPPRPWGAPAPEPSPYALPPIPFDSAQGRPDALGIPPPPPPPAAPAYGASPQYPGVAGYPRPGYGMPPPPPAPFGMPEFGIPRPQSGKAIGSLICAGLGVLCCAIALPIGLVLGGMGVAETGPNGTRSGRGLAITGLILNAVIIAGMITFYVVVIAASAAENHKAREAANRSIDADLDKIRVRLRAYYDQNNNSLGPGGPRLANANADYSTGYKNTPATPRRAGKVTEVLRLEDLIGDHELGMPLSAYELNITSSSSATVRSRGWGRSDHQTRVMKIFDIGLYADGQYTITDE